MTEQGPPSTSGGEGQPQGQPGEYGQQPYPQQGSEQDVSGQQPGAVQQYGEAPIGEIRKTGIGILLYIITLGIYGWYWWYKRHQEMKNHTGAGIGGGLALVLAIFVTIVMPFLTSSETGRLYERRGQHPPVAAVTGLWILLPIVGGIIWFVKTNNALNDYWRSLGASEPG